MKVLKLSQLYNNKVIIILIKISVVRSVTVHASYLYILECN